MLYAIQHNKAGRNFNNQEINWRQLFKSSEDSLTSMVFERLFYLPHELFWNILTNSCYGNELPNFSGPIEIKEFWPNWDASNTSNIVKVEPDVFIRFRQFDLIIEAKRWDYNQQSKDQWNNEIVAYKNEYGEDKKKLFFIALGGLYDNVTENHEGIEVIKCRWNRILRKVIEYQKQLTGTSEINISMNSVTNILNDLILVFQLHGYATGEWLSTLPVNSYKIKSQSIIDQWKI